MNEETTLAAQPAPQTPRPPAAPPAAPPATPWRDRALKLRVVAAVTVAALLVGGGAGALIGYAAHADGHDGARYSRMGGPGGVDGRGFAPPGGQLPPGTAPDDQQDAEPQGSGT